MRKILKKFEFSEFSRIKVLLLHDVETFLKKKINFRVEILCFKIRLIYDFLLWRNNLRY